MKCSLFRIIQNASHPKMLKNSPRADSALSQQGFNVNYMQKLILNFGLVCRHNLDFFWKYLEVKKLKWIKWEKESVICGVHVRFNSAALPLQKSIILSLVKFKYMYMYNTCKFNSGVHCLQQDWNNSTNECVGILIVY